MNPTTHQRDLAKLSRTLAPLIERPQWCVWRWTQRPNGSWQKPPFQALDPQRHASTTEPGTWSDYPTALAAVQAGKADGISYVLTEADPFAAMDLDHCRHPDTHSIDAWAQNFLDVTRHTYAEVTPSGEGCRIWGLTSENSAPVNRKFTLTIDGKPIAAELFRRTAKALTITGYRLDTIPALTNIDKAFDWALVWGERGKAAAAAEAATQIDGHSFNGGRPGHDIDHIERMVREGSLGGNRSDTFHAIVGHYLGCDWSVDQIHEHLQQFPNGIADKYIGEGRLRREIERSAGKYVERVLPVSGSWNPKPEPPADDPELEDDDPELKDSDDPELEDDEPPQQDSQLPQLYAHGDPDSRPLKSWLIKHLIPTVGSGMILGQWGTGKTFVIFDVATAASTGQPFLGHAVKRQCGVLLIAAEGADDVRLRLDAVVRAKCGDAERIPFRWYESTPLLLQKDAAKTLIAMARQADASLQEEFGLPLGLVFVDTISACAGYTQAGGESDAATGLAVMNVLKAIAQAIGCFVFGVHHLGKNKEAGARGTIATEDVSDVILVCLGDKQLAGSVTNTRLTVRKNKGGPEGQEYPFTLRKVEALEPDEDGDPVSTMVIDWQPIGTPGDAKPGPDPWVEGVRQDQRTAILRLKRVLMGAMAEHGVERQIPPDGPAVRMIDQEVVRELFYSQTPADGTPKQKLDIRRKQFKRALDLAEAQDAIAIHEIDNVVYLRLQPRAATDG